MADSGRREKDLDLVEDFETVRAVTADGKSVQVPKSKFGGNLEIASADVLGGIKASEKSESDTQEVKIDPNTGKLYCPPSEVSIATADKLGGIVASAKTSKETVEVKIDSATGKLYVPEGEGNPPDEEDITLTNIDGVDKLQFNDKQYNASSYSGLGRKYLRKNMVGGKNILVQSVFENIDGSVKGNTRYIIQYDYDLNSSTITIPDGAILVFDGGSFRNGTIKGNKYKIYSGKVKIFYNIIFSGNAVNSIKFKIDWFVSQFVDGIYDNVSIDSSTEINQAMSSGIKHVEFSGDRFYYLKSPIVVNGDVNIYSENNTHDFDASYRGTTGHVPCVYSNEIVTLLDYTYSSNSYKTGVTIGALNFYCRKTYSTLNDRDVPIVKVSSTTSTLWGLTFDANINAKDCPVDGNYIPNYTGLYIYTDGGNVSYVKIRGYIQMVFLGIRIENANGWATDTEIFGNTRCVLGGDFIGGEPVRVFGTHQPIQVPPELVAEEGYFRSDWINMYGFIWDLGVTVGSLKTVTAPVKFKTKDWKYNVLAGSKKLNMPYLHAESFDGQLFTPMNVQNMLNMSVYGDIFQKFSYTIDGEDIYSLTKAKLYNSQNLFNSESRMVSFANAALPNSRSHNCYIVASEAYSNSVIKLDFTLRNSSFQYNEKMQIYLFTTFMNSGTVKMYNGADNSLIYEEVLDYNHMFYYGNLYRLRIPLEDYDSVNVVIEYTFSVAKGGYYHMPVFYMPVTRSFIKENYGPTSKRPVPSIGAVVRYFDTDLKKPIWWYANNWYDATGSIV